MKRVPEKLIKETKVMIRLYLFLRHECELKFVDKLSARELREFLNCLKKKG